MTIVRGNITLGEPRPKQHKQKMLKEINQKRFTKLNSQHRKRQLTAAASVLLQSKVDYCIYTNTQTDPLTKPPGLTKYEAEPPLSSSTYSNSKQKTKKSLAHILRRRCWLMWTSHAMFTHVSSEVLLSVHELGQYPGLCPLSLSLNLTHLYWQNKTDCPTVYINQTWERSEI